MRKTFENKYNMSKVVQAYMEEQDAATLNTAPGLDAEVGLLKAINDEIIQLNEFQTMNRTGHRDNKDNSKLAVINSAMNCAFALMAYAKPIPNQVLFKEVKTARYKLVEIRDIELRTRCEFLYLRATEHQVELETYGITVAFLTNFAAQISEFVEQISQPRLSIAERFQLTSKIEIEFQKLSDLFKSMDTKVNAMSLLFPDFVNEYKTCRVTVNYRGSLLSLSGNIKDQAGFPIFGAICTLTELGREAKTTAKGNFEFKNVANGEYNLKVQRPGFETINLKVNIVKGETTKISLVMNVDLSVLRVA